MTAGRNRRHFRRETGARDPRNRIPRVRVARLPDPPEARYESPVAVAIGHLSLGMDALSLRQLGFRTWLRVDLATWLRELVECGSEGHGHRFRVESADGSGQRSSDCDGGTRSISKSVG